MHIRDSIEQDTKITELIKHSYGIQSQLMSEKRESNEQANAEHEDATSLNINDTRTFIDLQSKITKLQQDLAEQKRYNITLSQQVISLTDRLQEKDQQLLKTEQTIVELHQNSVSKEALTEMTKHLAQVQTSYEVQMNENKAIKEVITNLENKYMRANDEKERYLEEIMRIKT